MQARGQARFEAILDAAAALIAEHGTAGVTMHTLARHARTSIGSLYHFFPDRDSVLEALRERHRAAMLCVAATLVDVPAADWRKMTVAALIERIVSPFIDYVGSKPDYVPLMRAQDLTDESPDLVRTMERIMEARLSTLSAVERADCALMLHLLAAGTMSAALQFDASRLAFYTRELKRAMAGYLEAVEAGGRRAHDESSQAC